MTSNTRSTKRSRIYESYLTKILKNKFPDNGITGNAKQHLNSILIIITDKIANYCREMTSLSQKRTVSHGEISRSVALLFSESYTTKLVNSIITALDNLENNTEKGVSRHARAQLIIPPAIPEKFIREENKSTLMVTAKAPIALSAAIQTISPLPTIVFPPWSPSPSCTT